MAVRRIQLRGVILDASYDCDWAEDYIERGIISPESRIRRQLDEANAAGDSIVLEVCSPGGSVFAGIEIANAIAAYPDLSVEVGAYAASAAALVVLEAARAGKLVRVHHNSIMLFHGAWSVCSGGFGAHEDEALLLAQINQPMIDGLRTLGVPEERIVKGFSEGRAMTLSASECVQYKLASEMIDANASSPPISEDDANDILKRSGVALAAFASDFDPTLCLNSSDEGNDSSSAARIGELEARIVALEAENRSLQSAKDKEVAAVRSALSNELSQAQALVLDVRAQADAFRSESEKQISSLRAELDKARLDLEAAHTAHAALVGAVNSPDPEITSWDEAIARFGGREALRLYPSLAAEYRRSHH